MKKFFAWFTNKSKIVSALQLVVNVLSTLAKILPIITTIVSSASQKTALSKMCDVLVKVLDVLGALLAKLGVEVEVQIPEEADVAALGARATKKLLDTELAELEKSLDALKAL